MGRGGAEGFHRRNAGKRRDTRDDMSRTAFGTLGSRAFSGAFRLRPLHPARLPQLGCWYFALIGLGYMAVQLALLQRLSIVIGHPVTCLALVLASMLLGTGVGSALAGHERFRRARLAMLGLPMTGVGVLAAAFGHVDALDELPSVLWVGLLSTVVGLALGVALPTGIRTFALNSSTVAEAWALNGAFSVLGSALAALGGLLIGSRGLLIAAVPCYALAFLMVAVSCRKALPVGAVTTTAEVRVA